MKMKKRYLALALVFVFIMSSLIGCGSKGASATTLTEVVKQTQTMKTGTYTYSFGLTSTEKLMTMLEAQGDMDESIKPLVTDLIKAEYEIKVTVESMDPIVMSMKLGMKKAGSDKVLPITTAIVKDDAFYVNMAELRECLNSFNNPGVSMIAGLFTTKEDYLKYTLEDINKSMESLGQEQLTSITGEMQNFMKNSDNLTKFSTMITENFETAVKDVSPAVISNKDGKVIVNINNDNYEAALTKVFEDITKNKEAYLDQYIAVYETNEAMKANIDTIKADKQKTLDDMQKFCEETLKSLKEEKLAENDALDIKYETSVNGGEGSREIATDISFYLKSAEDDMELGLFAKGTGKEKIADKVTVPEKSTTIDEFSKSLGQ